MALSPEQRERQQQRIEDCRELYLKHGGENHELIEQEMRAMGYHDFHRRCLYRRYERGRCDTGWIERYGWDRLLSPEGTRIIAQGKDEVRHPGYHAQYSSDPAGVAQTTVDAAPLQGAETHGTSSPSATDFSLDFDDFKEWLQSRSPGMQWDFKHQVFLYKRLRKVFEGDLKRLMVFMPPRHGKSELVTKHFAAYFLKHNPDKKVIIGCYNQNLANKFSRGIKNIHLQDKFLSEPGAVATGFRDLKEKDPVANPGGSALRGCVAPPSAELPAATPRNPVATAPGSDFSFRPKNSVAEWETAEGGGVRAVGVGAGITGYGGNLIIIDDPTRSRADANSANHREKVWDWFNDDLTTRLEPDGGIILIQTRWHEDDLAGRLLKQMNEEGGEHWEVVNLPALATGAQASCLQTAPVLSEPGAVATGFLGESTIDLTERDVTQPQPRNQTYYILNGRQVPVHTLGQPKATEKSSPPYTVAGVPRNTGTSFVPERGVAGFSSPPYEGGVAAVSADGVVLSPAPDRSSVGRIPAEWRDELGRREGQALWPERYDEQRLEKIKHQMGSYSFAALYQQTPVPAEGGLFKRAWFKTVPYLPPNLKKKRGWDLAISKKIDADYTASAGVAWDDAGNMYIYDVIRQRIEYPEQKRLILGRILAEPDTEHGIETSANGNAVIQDLRRERSVRGNAFRGVKPESDKTSRALPWIALAEEGRVFLVRGPWNNEFIDEACSFPLGTHDDQIDAVSLAVALHKKEKHIAMGC